MSLRNFMQVRVSRAVMLCAVVSVLLLCAGNAWAWGENKGYVVNETTEHSGKREVLYIYTLSGEGVYLNYDVKCQWGGIPTLTVEGSADGSNYSQIESINNSFIGTSYKSKSNVSISSNVRYIRFTSGGTGDVYIKNVKVTRATTFSVSTNSLNLGTTGVNKELSGVVTLNFNNTTYPQQITATSDNAAFTVAIANASASETGSTTATITFNSATAGEYSGNITFNMNGKSATVAVSAKATEAVITSINWAQSFMSLSIYDEPATVDLTASVVDQQGNAISGANVTYSLGDDATGIVSLDGNQLTIVGVGETTITATFTSANEDQYTSSSNTKRIVVGDGSACRTMLVNDAQKHDISAWNSTVVYTWTAPAVATFSYDIWKANAATQDSKVVCKDANGNTLKTYTYSSSSLGTSSRKETKDLPAGTRRLEFSAGGTLNKYIQNVVVEQATYFEAVSTSLNATDEGVASTSVIFNFSNLPTAVSASLEGNHDEVLLDAEPIGEGCGDWQDGATMNLTFRPNGSGKRTYSYNGNLVLSAGSGENITSITIPLSVTITMPFGNLNQHFAMFYNEDEVSVDANAYYASWTEIGGETALELIQINENDENVPAQTPVLLHNADKDFYTYSIAEEPSPWTVNNNAFIHTSNSIDAANDENYNYYVLASKNDEVAFYKFIGTIPAGKVVLVWDKSEHFGNAPARFDMNMEGNVATALLPVWANDNCDEHMDGQIYTIMGLPVSSMSQPGIYIMNGKKYIVK